MDWQAVAVNGSQVTVDYYLNDPGCSLGLDRVEVDDNPRAVTLRFVVLYAGDEGATCPTSIATSTTVVDLPTPLGDRSLSGCHPDGFFLVPAGGYDNPAQRGDANGCMKPTPSTDAVFNTTAPAPNPSPDLGVVTDASSLVAALRASGPLDNEMTQAVATGSAPGLSICASIVQTTEPSAGTVVHQALATFDEQVGVVLVLQRENGQREARLYGTGEADPATGGCPLWMSTPI